MVFCFLFVSVVQKTYHNFNSMIISIFSILRYKLADKYFYKSCKFIWQPFSRLPVIHIAALPPDFG
jgi:hypothetical protein